MGQRSARTVSAVIILLLSTFSATSFAAVLSGHPLLPNIIPSAFAAGTLPILGIDCGLGSTTGVATPSPTTTYSDDRTGTLNTYSFGSANIPVSGEGILDTSCIGAGDADATFNSGVPDGTPELRVADSPENAAFSCSVTPSGCSSTNYGGGFNVEVRITGLDPACNDHATSVGCPNGFDISVSYDPKILNAVSFDQYGLEFCQTLGSTPDSLSTCGQPIFSGGVTTVADTIDNTIGVARLAQALLGVTTFPDASGNQGVTLFRIRFDVVGVGSSNLSFPCNATNPCDVVNPSAIAHTEQPATFEGRTSSTGPYVTVTSGASSDVFTIFPGNLSTTATVNVTPHNGYGSQPNALVTVSSTLPNPVTGLTASLSTGSVDLAAKSDGAPSSTTLTVSTTDAVAPANYPVVVTITYQVQNSTTEVISILSDRLNFVIRVLDYTVTTLSPVSFMAGSIGNSLITLGSLNGFTGTVTIRPVSIAPAIGLTQIIGPPASVFVVSVGEATVALRFTSVISGTYTVNYEASSTLSGFTRQKSFSVSATVLPPPSPDFTVTASPSTVLFKPNATGLASVSLFPLYDFTGTVNLSLNATSGLNCTLATSVTLPPSHSVPLSCIAAVAGIYTVTITGKSGSLTHSTSPITFRVENSLIATTTLFSPNLQSQPTVSPWAGEAFYAQGRHWLFFYNQSPCPITSASCLYYASSTDGTNWTTTKIGVVTGEISVITNSTRVFLVRYDGSRATTGQPILFRIGVLTTAGGINWQGDTIVKSGVSGQIFQSLSLGLGTDGTVFVAYRNSTYTGGSGLAYAIHSSGTNYDTWTRETLLRSVSDDWRFSWIQLNNGQMYLLYWPSWGALRGRLWDADWGSGEIITPAGTTVRKVAFGFNNGTNTPTAIWQENNSEKLLIAFRTLGIWRPPQQIGMAETNGRPRWSATFDAFHSKYYVVYYNYTTNIVYEYSGRAGSWSTRTLLFSTVGANSAMSIATYYQAGQISANQITVGIVYVENDNPSTNTSIRFAQEIVPD